MVVMRMILRYMRDEVLVMARDIFLHRTVTKLTPRCKRVRDDQLMPTPCSTMNHA